MTTGEGLARQVDGTTCGPSVLLALAAMAEGHQPSRARAGTAQRRAHRQANTFWPRFLGTTPFAMCSWLRRHAPAAGRYRIRWTFGRAPTSVLDAVTAAVAAGRPVPLMVGSWIPRHWVLVAGVHDGAWQVYEPSSGRVRRLDSAALRTRIASETLGWPHLHAVLLPVGTTSSKPTIRG